MTDTKSQMIIIMTTFPIKNTTILKKLITGSIKQGLSSCVQQVNYVKSFYLEKGKIKKGHEKLLLFKGLSSNKEKLVAFIKKMHPYDIPEIVELTPSDVDAEYMNWMVGK